MNTTVFLDYNSTTPLDEAVLDVMLPYFKHQFGNAASKTHVYGWQADEAVKHARKQVAHFINAQENEIVFTSGATEAINLAIKGVTDAYKAKGSHIITCVTEHKAVIDTCQYLEKKGASVTYLPVDENGLISIERFEKAITPQTILACIMLANNETGVIQPIKQLAAICKQKSILFFSDTTQACGKIAVDIQDLNIDLACISAHKMYGPKGVGALYLRKKDPRVNLVPLLHGGGHENGVRSGTLNVPGIVGLGKACELAAIHDHKEIEKLRNLLENELAHTGQVIINGKNASRLPNTSNIAFKNINAGTLIKALSGFAFATGSACTSANAEPSHVLKAMHISNELIQNSIRISLGKHSSPKEINSLIKGIKDL